MNLINLVHVLQKNLKCTNFMRTLVKSTRLNLKVSFYIDGKNFSYQFKKPKNDICTKFDKFEMIIKSADRRRAVKS